MLQDTSNEEYMNQSVLRVEGRKIFNYELNTLIDGKSLVWFVRAQTLMWCRRLGMLEIRIKRILKDCALEREKGWPKDVVVKGEKGEKNKEWNPAPDL